MRTFLNPLNAAISVAIIALLTLAGVVWWRPLIVVRSSAAAPTGLSTVPRFIRACVLNDRAWDATIADPTNRDFPQVKIRSLEEAALRFANKSKHSWVRSISLEGPPFVPSSTTVRPPLRGRG